MKKQYALSGETFDLSEMIRRHSGDETISYKTVNGEPIHLSYFYPDILSDGGHPALVLVHGGGWASRKIFPDQKDLWQGDYLGYLARYYSLKGYVCVCVDYRLSREGGQAHNYQLADCWDDCCDAMDYILDHAISHHIDTNDVSVLGESAGGHLAGLLATAYHRSGFRFQKAFLINSVLDFTSCPVWAGHIPKDTKHPVLQPMNFDARVGYLSPICHIHADLCPVVLIHGLEDNTVGVYHSENFYEKMLSMALSCDLHLIEKTRHAFMLAEYTNNPIANRIGISILDQYLLA